MARTDNDTWDLASSVGATATGVAVGRALASRGSNALIDDPFAEPLVRAVGVDFFTRMAAGELDPADVDDNAVFSMRRMVEMMAVRTRFIDEFFVDAAKSGLRQAVILAAGLDARAYRLPWPAGATVYEIDQRQVVDFKTRTLSDLGAEPTADRRAVGIDLRNDWPSALRQAGFDPARPTVWSAEGLLPFLPPDAQDRLLDNITELSAPGSRLVSENMTDMGEAAELQNNMREATASWRQHGFDIDDMDDLWYFDDDRNDVAEYLDGRGWQTTISLMVDLYTAYGLVIQTADGNKTDAFRSLSYVISTRT